MMLSVVIATADSERPLVATLAALVPGATAGLVREVIVSDAGSRDATVEVADSAGCGVIKSQAPLGQRIAEAAATARSSWLLFLRPGTVVDQAWLTETMQFMIAADAREGAKQAAVFRLATGGSHGFSVLGEIAALLRSALRGRPRPEQCLLIAKTLYVELGSHRSDVADPEADLLRRIGPGRIAVLHCYAYAAQGW